MDAYENYTVFKFLTIYCEGKDVNNICPIFTYSIEDGPCYMWMGDLETDMQQEYYDTYSDNIPRVNVLFQPHHGRKSASVPSDLLGKLNPQLIIIGNAPSEHIVRVHKSALPFSGLWLP